MVRHFLVLVTRCLALVILGSALANLGNAQDQAWLKSNQQYDPVRYEGLLDQPNARREYDVLALLAFAGRVPQKTFDGTPPKLYIHYCKPKAASSTTAYIEVRQLSGHTNYLMKTAQPIDISKSASSWLSFAWPTATVIGKSNISPNNLGVVIHFGEDNNYANNLLPASFSATDEPKALRTDHYQLVLRIQQSSLDSLSYQFHVGNAKVIKCYYQNELNPCKVGKPTSQFPIESGSLVNLPIDLSDVPAGTVTVHVDGHYHDSDEMLSANFTFEHEPECR